MIRINFWYRLSICSLGRNDINHPGFRCLFRKYVHSEWKSSVLNIVNGIASYVEQGTKYFYFFYLGRTTGQNSNSLVWIELEVTIMFQRSILLVLLAFVSWVSNSHNYFILLHIFPQLSFIFLYRVFKIKSPRLIPEFSTVVHFFHFPECNVRSERNVRYEWVRKPISKIRLKLNLL